MRRSSRGMGKGPVVPVVRNVYNLPPSGAEEEVDPIRIETFGPCVLLPPPLRTAAQFGFALSPEIRGVLSQHLNELPSAPAVFRCSLPVILSGVDTIVEPCDSWALDVPLRFGVSHPADSPDAQRRKLAVLCSALSTLVMHLNQQPLLEAAEGPGALVLCPSRQLCDECMVLVDSFGAPYRLVTHSLFEPFPVMPPHRRADIVVALPRQLNECFTGEKSFYTLRRISIIVVIALDAQIRNFGFYDSLASLFDPARSSPLQGPLLHNYQRVFIGVGDFVRTVSESCLGGISISRDAEKLKHEEKSVAVIREDTVRSNDDDLSLPLSKKRRTEVCTELAGEHRRPSVLNPTKTLLIFNCALPCDVDTDAAKDALLAEFAAGLDGVGAVCPMLELYGLRRSSTASKSASEPVFDVLPHTSGTQCDGVLLAVTTTDVSSALVVYKQTNGRFFDGRTLAVQFESKTAIVQPHYRTSCRSHFIIIRNCASSMKELCQRDDFATTMLDDLLQECGLHGQLSNDGAEHNGASCAVESLSPSGNDPIFVVHGGCALVWCGNQAHCSLDAVRICVSFVTSSSASEAVRCLDGRVFAGRKLVVSFFDPDRFSRAIELLQDGAPQEAFEIVAPSTTWERPSTFESDSSLLELLHDISA